MTNEREQFFQPLTLVDYDIAGNSFRAYYDADRKLVFVIDFLIDDIKPNVLLVINPVGDRKWDDILENDYGVDLETVRPKKNNKYQKYISSCLSLIVALGLTGCALEEEIVQPVKRGRGRPKKIVEEEPVVIDENIITSRGPATALVFALAVLGELGCINEMEEIQEGMLVNFYNKYGK